MAALRRFVIDTNVVLSGLLWRGAPYALLTQLGKDASLQIFSSVALLDELADVLLRASATKRLALIDKTAHELLADYVRAVTVLEPPALAQPVCRDPDDDTVLALAKAAQADVIVSGDNDLLVLQSFEGVAILTASQALERIASGV